MTISTVGVPFVLVIHEADIIRRNGKPDQIVLKTNLPNPNFPFQGTLSITITVNKGDAEKWLCFNIPQLKDISFYDDSRQKDVLALKAKSSK